MAANNILEPPAQLKVIQSYMKVASDVERIDPVVSYWVRLFSTETALTVDKDSPECKTFLGAIILWLEQFKKTHKDNEAVSNQTVGQAHMENFVVALFNKADTLDREGTANKNTVKMFYMAAILFEAMAVFGTLSEEMSKRAKYAKFKAAYIQKCLKLGQIPKPGPIEGADLEDPSYNQNETTTTSDDKKSDTLNSQDSSSDANNSKLPPDPYVMTPSSAPVYPPSTPSQFPQPTGTSPHKSEPAGSSSASIASSTTSTGGKATIEITKYQATNGVPLNAEDLMQGQKYCKFANSALQYDDIPTAVANLEKALKLLTTGQH